MTTFAVTDPDHTLGAVNYLLSNLNQSYGNGSGNANIPSNVLVANTTTGAVTQYGSITSTPISYLYEYINIRYADTADGSVNFSSSPTNRYYFGVYNSASSAASANPADYQWFLATGGFGTTKFLFYATNGGRQIQFAVATGSPSPIYAQTVDGVAIDLNIVSSATATPTPRSPLPQAFVLVPTDPNVATAATLTAWFSSPRANPTAPIGTGLSPVVGDTATFIWAAGASTATYTFDGSAWSTSVTQIMSGNLIVNNTITGNQIQANTISGNNIIAGSITANLINVSGLTVNSLQSLNANIGNYASDGTWIEAANGNARFGNIVSIGNYLTVGSDAVIGNNLSIGNTTTIGNLLVVQNNANIGNNLTIGANAAIGTNLTVGANAAIGDSLTIGNNATIGANLNVGNLINLGSLSSNTVGTIQLVNGAITTAKIQANAITGNVIAANTITGNLIAANTITGDNIMANTITGSDIQSGTITTNNFTANTINGNIIQSGTITANQINANGLTVNTVVSNNGTIGNTSSPGFWLQGSTGNAYFGNTLTVGNNLVVGANAVIGQYANIQAHANIGGNLIIGQNANIGQFLTVASNANIGGYAIIGQNLTVGQNCLIGANLNVGVNANIQNNAKIGNNVTIGNNLSVGGNITIADLAFSGNLIANTVSTTVIVPSSVSQPYTVLNNAIAWSNPGYATYVTLMPSVVIPVNNQYAVNYISGTVFGNWTWSSNASPASIVVKVNRQQGATTSTIMQQSQNIITGSAGNPYNGSFLVSYAGLIDSYAQGLVTGNATYTVTAAFIGGTDLSIVHANISTICYTTIQVLKR